MVLAFRGVSPKLASLRQGRALIRETLRSSAQPEGRGDGTGLCFARLGIGCSEAERSEGLLGSPIPSGCAEERRRRRDQGRSCLSEASSADPRLRRAPQVARSEAKGRRQQGRLFFAYFLLAKQKKVSRPPGRDPAPERTKPARLHRGRAKANGKLKTPSKVDNVTNPAT